MHQLDRVSRHTERFARTCEKLLGWPVLAASGSSRDIPGWPFSDPLLCSSSDPLLCSYLKLHAGTAGGIFAQNSFLGPKMSLDFK